MKLYQVSIDRSGEVINCYEGRGDLLKSDIGQVLFTGELMTEVVQAANEEHAIELALEGYRRRMDAGDWGEDILQ